MTQQQIRDELDGLIPHIQRVVSDHHTARGHTSIADIEVKRQLHGWRLSQLYDYQQRLHDEQLRRTNRRAVREKLHRK